MLENLKEKTNALTSIADLIGKKPLVIMVMFFMATTYYLYIDTRRLNDIRIEELKKNQEEMINTIKGIERKQDIYIPKLDTTLKNANKTLEKLNNQQ